jgi:hypothetical protein
MYLASALPDMYAMAPAPKPVRGRLKHLTHYDPSRMPPGPFAAAFASHNGDWGTDSFAHAYFYHPETPTFMTAAIRRFCAATGLDEHGAEDYIEAIVEYVVRKTWGGELGSLLTACADAATPEHEQMLVDAYAAPLAEETGEREPAHAEMVVRGAFRGYCGLLRVYGKYMALPEKDIADTVPRLIAAAFGISEAAARERVALVTDEADAWAAEFKRMGAELRGRIEAHGMTLSANALH